jgi:hypothetical protein
LGGDSLVAQARETLTARLMELYDQHAHADWSWFEEELSYDNARLSHALIVSGRATGQEAVLNRGLETLRWLVEQQTTEMGHLRPPVISAGTSRHNTTSTGSSAATIWASNSTCRRPAAAAMDCTWTG